MSPVKCLAGTALAAAVFLGAFPLRGADARSEKNDSAQSEIKKNCEITDLGFVLGQDSEDTAPKTVRTSGGKAGPPEKPVKTQEAKTPSPPVPDDIISVPENYTMSPGETRPLPRILGVDKNTRKQFELGKESQTEWTAGPPLTIDGKKFTVSASAAPGGAAALAATVKSGGKIYSREIKVTVAQAGGKVAAQETAVRAEKEKTPPPVKTAGVIKDSPAQNDGDDEMSPVISPVSDSDLRAPSAGGELSVAANPGALLDKLGGGRPGGDAAALAALLRQAGGPLSESEDKTLTTRTATLGRSPFGKTKEAVRAQSELLLKAMFYRQMMTAAAWEYDFALAQRQIAMLMKDNEEAQIAGLIADMQMQSVREAQANLEKVKEQSEKAPRIPTPEELKQREDALRQTAEEALGIKPAAPAGKTLAGTLRLEKVIPELDKKSDDVYEFKGNSITFYRNYHLINAPKPWIEKAELSWKAPELLYFYEPVRDSDVWFPFKVTLKDTGSQISDNVKISASTSVYYVNASCDSYKALNDACYNAKFRAKEIAPGPTLVISESKPEDKIEDLKSNPPRVMHTLNGTNEWSRSDGPIVFKTFYVYARLSIVYQSVLFRYKWETDPNQGGAKPEPGKQDARLSDDKNAQIAEHEANIAASKKAIEGIQREMASEKDRARLEELRLQSLHVEQDIHDSKDLIESIRTGVTVKTRGPWDEHAAVTLAQTSIKMSEDFQRARQMQASYARMLKTLEKHNPEAARKFHEQFREQMIKGVYEPGGFEKAKAALDTLQSSARTAVKDTQDKNLSDQARSQAELERAERNLAAAECIKRNCDRGIFVGTLLTGMAPGMALSMVYEGSCVTAEKGPAEAVKTMAMQGGIMLAGMGAMKAGGWAIGKFLNPKVAKSEVNTFKNILEANRYQQEMEWNQALVSRLKEQAANFEKCKAAGGKNYLAARTALDDAVSAVNGSSLAKNIMKNELNAAEKAMAKGGQEAAAAYQEVSSYQKLYSKRLDTSIYPRTDAKMVGSLQKQGYNAEAGWFREFRNATSKGANRDRDLGLLSQFEGKLTKNGKPVSLSEFMKDGQKAYDESFKQVTGRSAKLADQNITTSAHSESFPLKWLEQKLGSTPSSGDYGKAGTAIYNKVRNAMTGPDPAFVNMKKACSSLAKDLKTKVLPKLETPPQGGGVSESSRKAAQEYWERVRAVMDDFGSDKIDPLTAMNKLQSLTGSTSVTQSAAEVQRLMIRLGGGGK
jgi:hypothetical protein